MDEIEAGYNALIRRIKEAETEKEQMTAEVAGKRAELLARMGEMAAPIVGRIGMNLLKKGRKDTKGEIFNPEYYRERMIVLGRTDPLPYRPDDAQKRVNDQFCTLNEKGEFMELMYSTEGMEVDSYACPLSAADAIEIYGDEVMLMLYRALSEYYKEEEETVAALGRTLDLITGKKEEKSD
ncbi:hypothetical protein [Methanofollis fontis]|uniref:Uncharacterized protein n=1 Tax=Methanofollis fontis TaxID=2052832 RepID=A0A483CNF2_9EURY|nr:hypothetical protein [Methanofollis fontis]TAJ44592.1 hypothetical protein CUJ86_04600 [Methanofollis fontis]